MKLVPKVHKLKGPISLDSWKQLKSRPIRGAENDPIKDPSKALYSLLQEMLGKFKTVFPKLDNDQIEHFTVLKGCDDNTKRLSFLKLDKQKSSQTILITADFSDAYTETDIEHLKESLRTVGLLVKYEDHHITLLEKLVDLVFLNCYFYTPNGLYRQTKGMPMGDYSSRESLDVELTRSEYFIINSIMNLSLKIHLFCRLVDDISLIVQGQFSEIPNVLEIMASKFPKKMPLNCQISSGYSRFLDLHILNMHNSSHNLHYNLVHTLAYKDTSTFNYTPASSNVHPRYKHAVVPISLHRIQRCTFQNDIDHHLSFMSSLLLCRNQDSSEVKKRTHRFFKNKMKSSNSRNCYC